MKLSRLHHVAVICGVDAYVLTHLHPDHFDMAPKAHGFGVLQFNAVVEDNVHARHLYERLGFTQLGMIPRGFRMNDGSFANICPYFKEIV